MQETVLAFDRLGGAFDALARHGGGGQAVHRRPAYLEPLGPGAVGEELQAAGGLAQRDAEGGGNVVGAEAEHASRGGRGTEGAAGGGGVEAAIVVFAGGQSERDA